MASLGWVLNLGFAGGGTVVADDSSAVVQVQRTGPLRRYIASWVASDAGGVSLAFGSSAAPFFVGMIYRAVTQPGTMSPPTDNYDIVLENAIGVDVLGGALADRDTANTEQAWIKDVLTNAHHQHVSMHCRYCLKVTNAGAGGSGVIVIYTRES